VATCAAPNRQRGTSFDRDGEGEGKMSIATKVIYDQKENMISLENYQTSPVQLTNIKRERVTH
jgi:hypothetical protein